MPTAPKVLAVSRTDLRRWARERDLASLDQAMPRLDGKALLIAVEAAMRAGWIPALERLWQRNGVEPRRFLSTAWKDLRNRVWSGVPQADRQAVEDWLEHLTWGPARDDAHRQAQAEAGAYALRSALDNGDAQRWALALHRHNTPVNNAAGARLLATLMGQHFDTTHDARPLKGWRFTALCDLLDRRVPMKDQDIVTVFERGEDDLFERCLEHPLSARSAEQRALLLASTGLARAVRARKPVGQQVGQPGRDERWFRTVMRHGIVPVLLVTTQDLVKITGFRDPRLILRGTGLRGPLLETREDDPRLVLFVSDHWWLDTRTPVNATERVEHRARLQAMIETPILRAALDEGDPTTVPASPARPRARL